MGFQIINPATPIGTSKKKFGDDIIRELKSQIIAALQTISNYPNSDHLLTNVWSNSTRPSENLKDGIFGFNTDSKRMEVYSGGAFLNASGRIVGEIVMWGGTEADIATLCNPHGFYLCNGENGTVDLRDKFIVASGATRGHKTSGGADVHVHTTGDCTLTVEQMPSHNHTLTSVNGSLSDNGNVGGTFVMDNNEGVYGTQSNPIATISSAGGGLSHNHGSTSSVSNVPAYYSLCFIQKVS